MKNIILSTIAIFSLIAFTSCRVETAKDLGSMQTYSVNAADFSAIQIGYPCDVEYVPSDTFAVTVKAPEKLRQRIVFNVQDGELQINELDEEGEDVRVLGNTLIMNNMSPMVKVTVKAPVLTKVTITGSGSFGCKSVMRAPQLYLSVAGSGDMDIKNVLAQVVVVNIEGSGDIDAGLTQVAKTGIQIAGSGDVDIHFTQCGTVAAAIAGSGDIKLSGDVTAFNKKIAGAGDIETSGLTVHK